MFVLPTYYLPEGQPWVIVEAMAAGLPIIATAQGAIPESVIDEANGYLVPKQDPEALAEKMRSLILDSDLRAKMGKQSRIFYEKSFTEEVMIRSLSIVFRRVLSTRSAL